MSSDTVYKPTFTNPIKVKYGNKRLAKLGCLLCDTKIVAHCPTKTDNMGDFGDTEHIKCPFCGGVGDSVFVNWVSDYLVNTRYKDAWLYPLGVIDEDFVNGNGTPPDSDEQSNETSTDEDETEDWEPQTVD